MTARAVLHHVADPAAAVANLVASARPGGAILLIERDFLPVSMAEPAEVRAFWSGWLAWSREQGIDYFIGRRPPAVLSGLGLEEAPSRSRPDRTPPPPPTPSPTTSAAPSIASMGVQGRTGVSQLRFSTAKTKGQEPMAAVEP